VVDSLLGGIVGNGRVQQILICWTTPLLLSSLAFVIIVLPDVRHAAVVSSVEQAVQVLHVNKFLFVFVTSLAGGAFLYVNRLPLWQLLEGYTWPGYLKRWRIIRAHVPQCRWLQASLEYERAVLKASRDEAALAQARADGATPARIAELAQAADKSQQVKSAWHEHVEAANGYRRTRDRRRPDEKGPHWPRRRQPLFTFGRPAHVQPGRWSLPYPAVPGALLAYPRTPEYQPDLDSTQILPTRLGNAMRVMETYGVNTYGLDSQIMWYELLVESPESMQASLEQAQLEADTLVCGIYAMAVLACFALAGGAWRAANGVADPKLWITAAASVIVALVLYRRLLNSVEGWASLVRALVNKTRDVLREKYGLRVPASPEDERRMWQALTASHWYGPHGSHGDELAEFRQPAAVPEPADGHGQAAGFTVSIRRLLR
jgi:hypothetical protein